MDDGWYRLGEIVIATIGIREGVVAIVMQLIGRGHADWTSLPLYLPNPWNYTAAAGVVVVAFIALAALGRARLAAVARAER